MPAFNNCPDVPIPILNLLKELSPCKWSIMFLRPLWPPCPPDSFSFISELGRSSSSWAIRICSVLRLKNFSEIRRSLPFRTIFNLLGPLLNPVKLDYQLLGVSDEKNLETHAKCISKLNLKKAWVVYNLNGYDELTTTSKNLFIEVKNGKLSKKKVLDPGEIGFKIRKDQELRGGSAQENSFLMKRVFEGETGAIRDNIVLNAAAGLLISDKVTTIKQGISVVENKINNGLILNKLKSLTQK